MAICTEIITMKKMNNEEWRYIKGFEGIFQVSDQGRVKRLSYDVKRGYGYIHMEEKIITPFTWQSRYLRVDLHYCGKRLSIYVHKLVAETFIGERPEGYVIDHINRDYLDNRLCNLRYITPSENINNVSDEIKAKRKKPKAEKTKNLISISTTEAMWRPEVHSKLGSGVRGKCWYFDKELNKRVYYDKAS